MLLLQLISSVCHGLLVETCEELHAAFDLTKTEDVVIEVDPSGRIECAQFTTMTMDSNTLTVNPSDRFGGNTRLTNIRFEVTNGAQIVWEPPVAFHGTDTQNINGGALWIGEGSTVHFLNDLEAFDVGVTNVRDEDSDHASFVRSGGCVYADGSLRVDGEALFDNCEVTGAGESPPGPGGALYIGATGSVLFNGVVAIKYVSIVDDGGAEGGGIYNEGTVVIHGDTTFEAVSAWNGGAIFNEAGADFRFESQAKAVFVDCSTRDGFGSALYNKGYFEFSGPALFYDTESPAVVAASGGKTVLSNNSVFWTDDDSDGEPAVLATSEEELVVPRSVAFIGNEEADCGTVLYTVDDSCL